MSIKDMREFLHDLGLAIDASPEPAKLRPAVQEALSGDCIQCAIRMNGADLLSVNDEANRDPRLERLRVGYCARNGCDSQFYAVATAPHPGVNWSALITPGDVLHSTQIESEPTAPKVHIPFAVRIKGAALRTTIALAALVIVFIIRQYVMGGRIPFIREPENFQVDRHEAP